jgi:hypothetical protein
MDTYLDTLLLYKPLSDICTNFSAPVKNIEQND